LPYYRIVIWTSQRQEPFTGIRQINNYNVDAVQHIMRVKAEETYRRDLIDVEVQMISKVSTAVKKYLEGLQKKREANKWSPSNTPFAPAKWHRDQYKDQEQIPLGKRRGLI
jgi:hypothetical protein